MSRADNRKRVHASRWVRRGVIIMTLMGLFLVGMGLKVEAAEVDPYGIAKFESKSVCIEHSISNSYARVGLGRAVTDFHNNTNLSLFYRTDCGTGPHIRVVSGYYGTSVPWIASTAVGKPTESVKFPNGLWGLNQLGEAVIRLNLTYSKYWKTYNSAQHILAHELGHAFGLDHRTDTCNSVMSTLNCPQPYLLAADDRRYINILYPNLAVYKPPTRS